MRQAMGRTYHDSGVKDNDSWRDRRAEIKASREDAAWEAELARDARRGRGGQVLARVRRGIGFTRG